MTCPRLITVEFEESFQIGHPDHQCVARVYCPTHGTANHLKKKIEESIYANMNLLSSYLGDHELTYTVIDFRYRRDFGDNKNFDAMKTRGPVPETFSNA